MKRHIAFLFALLALPALADEMVPLEDFKREAGI